MNRMLNAIILGILTCQMALGASPWTRVYPIKIKTEIERLQGNELLIERNHLPLFSQLILGFNGTRPRKGNFTFYVSAHNPQTGRWGKWHKMMDWGSTLQRSYTSSSDGHTHFAHVRLETEKDNHADGFRIKVEASVPSTINQLKHMYVTTANYEKFMSELYSAELFKNLSSTRVSRIPCMSQFTTNHPENFRICSPTSCSMVSTFLQKRRIDPSIFAEAVFDDGLDTYGNWPFNTAHMFELHKKNPIFPTRLNSFVDLHRQLKRGLPVIVSVRGTMMGAAKPYLNGHLLVVTGWDNKKMEIICHDPAFESDDKIEHRYPLKEFIQAWELSKRLVYWVSPDKSV